MSDDQQETKPEIKSALDLACYELNYRRKKQWDIFSWVVTILVSVIGGIIVLTSKGEIKPDLISRGVMAIALGLLTVYACFWIDENIAAETEAHNAIKKLLGVEKVDAIRAPSEFRLGYVAVVLIIGIGAVGAVVLVNLFPGWGYLRGH